MANIDISKVLKLLKDKKLLSEEQSRELSEKKFSSFAEAEKYIRRMVLIMDEDWAEAKGLFYDIEYANLIGADIKPEVLNILPQDLSENYQLVVFKKEDNLIKAGLVDPTNFKAIEALNFLARKNDYKVKYYIISLDSYQAASKQYETLGEEVGEALDTAESIFAPQDALMSGEDVNEMIKSAPVSKIVSVILRHAIEGRASDIHIEPVGKQSKIRYRIDGVLHTTIVLPIYVHAALVSRIKVMANLKIDETRVPQDGRIRITINKKDIDFRVSTIPLMGQEKVVMRILRTPDRAPKFYDLGFRGLQIDIMERSIKKHHGLFLLTGPTGSGKSTTLFAALSYLNSEDVNIATLEDPVEYYIPGVNQSQVRPEVNFTFATGLRSLLRQDPDIIMVGEIRDNETAELAIHASLTGHSVLSTLHTNDAAGAIPRLFDMGIEPFLLANTLNAIIAQRLVRKICDKCKEEYNPPEDIKEQVRKTLEGIPKKALFGDVDIHKLKFWKGKGCPMCGEVGYKGRLVISESIQISRGLQDAIVKGFHHSDVDEELAKQHFMTMEQDGLIKALLGHTTLEEILRVSKI